MSNKSESENNKSACANCGKGEEASSDLKACTACKLIKYCNRECQIAHRPQHKKECKKRAKELHDEKLFKQPPPLEDCPICFLRMPLLGTGRMYMLCCGKVVCIGCTYAPVHDDKGNVIAEKTCPFCRTPIPTSDEETNKRLEKRMELNDDIAMYNLGFNYISGSLDLPQDHAKALELYHRAAELGNANAYYAIGYGYAHGEGVERDKKKATQYYELAAMRGNVEARQDLGAMEGQAGNNDRALKHYMISVRDGNLQSLKNIKRMYMFGYTTKDDYTKALRSYQAYLDEIKSDQRDKVAAFSDRFRYYETAIEE